MKNKTALILLTLSLPLIGCNTLKKQFGGTGTHDVPNNTLPDDYTVTGITAADFQIIQPVRCLDSDVTVEVKEPGAVAFRPLNKYEFKADTNGVGGGGVWFKRLCYATFDKDGKLIYIVVTPMPVAPTGTEYKIRSILKVTSHSLY